ncbi:MAG TPA: DUF4954 family protein [Planctomycetes bacterium]|nr:DUF4954 family protein [Planctomycetota bacterium]
MTTQQHRALKPEEIKALEARNCQAADWAKVKVADPFDAKRLYGVIFHGECRLGRLDGTVTAEDNRIRRAGIYRATLDTVTTGDNVLINQVNGYIANYTIKSGAIVQGVGVMEASAGAAFGLGVEVEAVNEGGGRGIPIFEELSAQLAHITALHRYRPALVKKLKEMIARRVDEAKKGGAYVGECAIIRNVPHMKNVRIGPYASVIGASYLSNGTVMSEQAAPTVVGSGVILKDFIVGESSSILDSTILERVFIGQGVKAGKQYSAENCLFFANSECFHGEGCSVFGGPYTVTHHKSTLLIAGLFSFYNAGSGSNQSNHMYKLGPIHQGVLERGSKTGSFSYLLWPCRIGPFSVVIGKHMNNFDIGDLPFSYVNAESEKSYVIPGMNIFTVGTVRDAAKWPARDRRKSTVKRDLIIFDAFSPYTVGRMIKGEKMCEKLYTETPRDVEEVNCGGALIRRRILRAGKKNYAAAIDAYLYDRVFSRAEKALASGKSPADVTGALAVDDAAVYDEFWVDVGGLLATHKRIDEVEKSIESGTAATLDNVVEALKKVWEAYPGDEWAWVCSAYKERFGKNPADLSAAELAAMADAWLNAKRRFIKTVLADAEREFSEISSIGFGADGPPEAREADFQAVRGTYGTDKFVRQLTEELQAVEKRSADFKAALGKLTT